MEQYKKYIIRVTPKAFIGAPIWHHEGDELRPTLPADYVWRSSINNAYPFDDMGMAWQVAQRFGGEVIPLVLGQVVTQVDFEKFQKSRA